MERDETRDPKWDRDQWAPDRDDEVPEGEHKATWNRHQWASDQAGTSPDTIGGAGVDGTVTGATETANELDEETADMHGISGRGKPSGESHWERNDPKR